MNLIAFNVQGDAFLIEEKIEGERSNYVLVDGGQDDQFADKYYDELRGKEIKTVVCTHTDADHADGIISFFRSGFTCDEIWLPALWTSNLTDILNGNNRFLKELAQELKEVTEKGEFNLRKYLKNTNDRIKKEGSLADLEETIENFRNEKTKLLTFFKSNPIYSDFGDYSDHEFLRYLWFQENQYKGGLQSLFKSADIFDFHLETFSLADPQLKTDVVKYYSKIVTIVLYALLRGVQRIRWWEYVEDNNAITSEIDRCNEVITPLCHKELSGVIKNYKKIYEYKLSEVNKESIVLISKEYGILISSDSDLTACHYIPTFNIGENMLITSPHHGSYNNASAFYRINKYLDEHSLKGVWIRTDSGHIRMGDDFPGIRKSRRYCVSCYNWDKDRKRKALIQSQGNFINAKYKSKWTIQGNNCECTFDF